MGRALAWVVGVVRAVTGVVLLGAAGQSAQRWVGSDGTTERYFVRGIGGRDLVLGGGLVHALATDRDPGPWLTASVLGDVTDAVAAVALDDEHGRTAMLVAGGFGLVGLVARLATAD